MPTIAIVGAGPGLGLSIAKAFGSHGFDVTLISRNKDKLDTLVAELSETGITAEGFPADVADPDQLTGALQAAIARFGQIDVLEFSPHTGLTMTAPKDVRSPITARPHLSSHPAKDFQRRPLSSSVGSPGTGIGGHRAPGHRPPPPVTLFVASQ
ncbi:SDR family NAD(P)-dependent oxidoreductase [Streptomyces griseobrunneus]